METNDSRYRTEVLEIGLGGETFRISRVTNTDELYAQLIAKGEDHADVRDERIPYWADLWPSALALAEEVMSNPAIGPGVKVLEIGCGMALPGIAAARRGASVILTDYMEEPLAFAGLNWRQNLDSEPDLRLLDWREPPPGLTCDILLASDVAYEKRSFDYLLKAFHSLMRPGGRILLSEPNRSLAVDFFQKLPENGYDFNKKSKSITLNDRINEICVYEIKSL